MSWGCRSIFPKQGGVFFASVLADDFSPRDFMDLGLRARVLRRSYETKSAKAPEGGTRFHKQEAAEEFWGRCAGALRPRLQQMLEADSEQQMADYLGLARFTVR